MVNTVESISHAAALSGSAQKSGGVEEFNTASFPPFSVSGVAHESPHQGVEFLNAALTPGWHQRPAIIGTGAYGTAIGHRLSQNGTDVMLVGRNHAVVDEINESHANSSNLAGRSLDRDLKATASSAIGFLNRGTIVLAVPSLAFESALEGKSFHPDSIVVSMAKGLIIEGWDPLKSKNGLKEGPSPDHRVMTPMQYLAEHPATKDIRGRCVVSGPGFAADIIDGDILDLAVASADENAISEVAQLFESGAIVSRSPDVIGVEIAATMKNVIAIMVGICDGLSEKFGTTVFPRRYGEVIKRMGIQEAAKLSEHLGGSHRTLLGPAGYPDLNLTTSSPTGRNYSLGLKLASGGDVDAIVRSQGKVVEGAWSAWGIKRLSDDAPGAPGVFMPVTNALIDIFRGTPPDVCLERLMKKLRNADGHHSLRWISHEGVVAVN